MIWVSCKLNCRLFNLNYSQMYELATWWLLLVFSVLLFYRGFAFDFCFAPTIAGMALYQLFMYGYKSGNQSCGYLAISLFGFLPFLLAISISLQLYREKYYPQQRDVFLGFSIVLAGIGILFLYINLKQKNWTFVYKFSCVAIAVLSLLLGLMMNILGVLLLAVLSFFLCFEQFSWVFMLLIAVYAWIEPILLP